jgi:hypothetical protein
MQPISMRTLGLIGGGLFFAHAMVPYSHAWPLVWPALAGAIGTYQASPRVHGFFSGIGVAARIGLVAAILFLVTTAATLALLAGPSFASVATSLGAKGPISVSGALLASLAVAASIGVLAAILAGALTYPFARRRV